MENLACDTSGFTTEIIIGCQARGFVDGNRKDCLCLLTVLKFFSSQILNGVARYALVNAIANSFLEFETSGVLYVGGLLLRQGAITVLQLWRCACTEANIVSVL